MSKPFPLSFTNRSNTVPNLPDDETLIPKENWRGSKFVKMEPIISITANDGTTNRFDQCANKAKETTAKIERLAPAKTDDGMLLFVVLILSGAVFVGGCIGYCIGVH